MKVADRIEQASACEVINLTDSEKSIYSGAGWKIARFARGALVDIFDPMNVHYNADEKAMTRAAVDQAIAWMDDKNNCSDEFVLVMCSCYQLCAPLVIAPADASGIARMARLIHEQFIFGQE